MSYSCYCVSSKFHLNIDDMGEALRLLAPTQYGPIGVSEEEILKVCDNGSLGEKQSLLHKAFLDCGYSLGYDGNGNACSIHHHKEHWLDDYLFFDVFAKYVEKGSYIEMRGESNNVWRMYFDGEHCREIEPVITWPDMDNSYMYKTAKDVEFEDFKNSIELLDYSCDDYSLEDLRSAFEDVYDLLGNDDVYNAIFNETICEVMNKLDKSKGLIDSVDRIISDAGSKCEKMNNAVALEDLDYGK